MNPRTAKFSLQFIHVGAKCPACGYVFTRGFSPIEVPDDTNDRQWPIGPCTRCRRIFEVNKQGLRLLDETELMLISDKERETMAMLGQILDRYTAGQS